MTDYVLRATMKGVKPFHSDIIKSKEEAIAAQKSMLDVWGIPSEIQVYDSEPKDDGYDLDKYY